MRTIGDANVQKALQNVVILELIDIYSYNGRPVNTPQPRPRGGYLTPDLITKLASPEVQEALKLPLVQELIFAPKYDINAYNGRPVNTPQPKPRGN